ncbi:TonB-dependent receptor [Phocaeicola plebeius]|uniref:TonB-dependent receptor n=1 Tax=Phocaeicola plebeius TaxID=310297 RepID=UPI00307C30D3
MRYFNKAMLVASAALCLNLSAFSQNITLKTDNVTVKEAIELLKKNTGYSFVFSSSDLNTKQRVSISANNATIQEVINQILGGQKDLDYEIQGKKIVVRKAASVSSSLLQNKKSVSGKVVDTNNEPIIGAAIVEKGTTNGTITDFDGNFILNVTNGAQLEVSYVGFQSQVIKAVYGKNLDVILKEDAEMLDEVVVVGYGTLKKKLVTGATVQVKGEDLAKLNTTTAASAMQSNTPGVQITQNSGLPGSGYKINIRGIGTMGNSSPLVIIDGIIGGDLNSLSTSDIESIDVLKDAASAAIYGARAANGVILVTTKSGKEGKTSVSYDGYVGIQNPGKSLDVLNAYDYIDYINEATDNSGLPRLDLENSIPMYNELMSGTWKGTNWLKEYENKNAFTQNHAFNLTSGNSRSLFSMGLTYTTQEAVYGSPSPMKYERYTWRINSDHVVYKKNDRDIIKVGQRLIYTAVNKQNSSMAIGGRLGNDIRNMNFMMPVMPVYDNEGNFSTPIPLESTTGNPIASSFYKNSNNKNSNRSLNGNIYLEISPIKNLRLKSSFNLYINDSSYRNFVPVYTVSTTDYNPEAKVSQSKNNNMAFQWENTLSYDLKLKGNHTFNFIFGQSIEKAGLGDGIDGTNINPIYDGFDYAYLSNCKSTVIGKTVLTGAPNVRSQLASFFGRINYNYYEKYLLTLVMRADGSSNFARGNRWGYFPSISAGWVITNENFMESTRGWLDFLKLRASWGQNGNQAISNFQYLASYAVGGLRDYTFGIDKTSWETGTYANIMPNKDVTWETSEQINIGVDARVLDGRMSIVLDWYNKTTKDWLVQAPILSSFGAGAPYINGGAIQNRGLEISLGWNDQIGEFHYGANLNTSFNKNKITRIDNSEGVILGANQLFAPSGSEIYRAEVGKPIGYFYGYKTAGVFQNQQQIDNYKGAKLEGTEPGDVIFVDTNNDQAINDEDKTMIGNPNPDMTMGFSLNLGYKGFDFSLTAYGAFGHQVAACLRDPALPLYNQTQEFYNNRWHGEGTSNRYPRMTYGLSSNWLNFSDIYIEDADYLKIQNITIGYDFKRLIPNLPLQQARLFVTGQNLFTITKYFGADPEVGFAGDSWAKGVDVGFYSAPKSLLLGVNLKF